MKEKISMPKQEKDQVDPMLVLMFLMIIISAYFTIREGFPLKESFGFLVILLCVIHTLITNYIGTGNIFKTKRTVFTILKSLLKKIF
jgi:hypothetical protein